MKIVEFLDVEYSYGKHKVLEGINFHVKRGDIIGLLGANGTGKSTIMGLCSTLLQPTKGDIYYFEQKKANLKSIRSKIGFVPQEIALYNHLTASENLNFFAKLCGLRGKTLKERLESVAERVKISLKDKKKIKQLSGGMQRRVNIAVGLINNPEILIMDEPTVGIDAESKTHILKGIKDLVAEGTCILYASHYIDEIMDISTKKLVLKGGELLPYNEE